MSLISFSLLTFLCSQALGIWLATKETELGKRLKAHEKKDFCNSIGIDSVCIVVPVLLFVEQPCRYAITSFRTL